MTFSIQSRNRRNVSPTCRQKREKTGIRTFLRAGAPVVCVLFGAIFAFFPTDGTLCGAAQRTQNTAVRGTNAAEATATEEEMDKEGEEADSGVVELGGRRFVTRDGVLMTGAYYRGNDDQDTVPVVLLHAFGKDRHEFDPLIPELQNRGYALIIPDLRGHGKSVRRLKRTESVVTREEPIPVAEPRRGPSSHAPGMGPSMPPFSARNREPHMEIVPREQVTSSLDAVDYLYEDFKQRDIEAMMNLDTVPFRRFLVEANNGEHLNLKKLVIVGVDSGGTVGAFWVKSDWTSARTRCTKSLIIVSPNFDTISKRVFNDSKTFRDNVSLTFFVGERNQRFLGNATELRNGILGNEKEKFADYAAADTKVPLVALPSELQGSDLLSREKLNVPQKIAERIEGRLSELKEKDLKWKKF